jgi:hypothetical protein
VLICVTKQVLLPHHFDNISVGSFDIAELFSAAPYLVSFLLGEIVYVFDLVIRVHGLRKGDALLAFLGAFTACHGDSMVRKVVR